MMNRQSQLDNAQREAAARNQILAGGISQLEGDYNNINAPAFSGAVGAVNPNTLKPAQDARTSAILGNVKGPASMPTTAGAPPALASTRAGMMKNATDFIHKQGTATGNLGGYGDQWFNSNLAEQDAARKIGVGNSFANETKSLIGPEQDLAGAAAYRPPSPIGGILQGVGGMMGANAGSKSPIFGPQGGVSSAFSFPFANFSGGF